MYGLWLLLVDESCMLKLPTKARANTKTAASAEKNMRKAQEGLVLVREQASTMTDLQPAVGFNAKLLGMMCLTCTCTNADMTSEQCSSSCSIRSYTLSPPVHVLHAKGGERICPICVCLYTASFYIIRTQRTVEESGVP